MRPLVLLWGFLMLPGYRALMGPKEVRGFEGDTVSLQCSYSEKLRKYKKYWCRRTGLLLSRCYDTIYTREDGQEWTQGRVSIQDSPQTLRFNVTLRKLTLPDSGEYLCGVSILGIDETFVVSLRVLPGPCCTPFPTPSFQPLATSFQPKAKAWQSRPPELTSPGIHLTVTTAKQGKKKAKASPFPETSPYEHARTSLYTRTSPYAGASPHALTPPYEETSPHKATSPHAGTSRPSTHLDSTLAGDVTSLPTSSSSSRYRVSSPMVRILAPVLVLLTLLLAAGLAALGKYMLRCRKEVQLASETQRNEKAQPSHLPLGNDLVPEYAKINLAAPKGPQASPKASPSSYKDIRHLGQTSEEEEDYYLEGEASPGPPLPMSEEELRLSTFIPV